MSLSDSLTGNPLAEANLNRLRQDARQRPQDAVAKIALADALVIAGRDREAEKSYRGVLRRDPKRSDVRIKLGGVLARLGRSNETERLLFKLLGDPILEKTEIRNIFVDVVASAWCVAKESQVAAGLVRLQQNAPAPDILVEVAKALAAKGQLAAAAEACNVTLDRWSQDTDAFAQLAKVLLDADDPDGAILACGKAIELDMSRIDARITLALSLIKASHYQEAEQILQDALLLAPNNSEVLGTYANLLHGLGRYGEARILLDRAIAEYPEVANLHSLRGQVLMRMSKFEEALESLDQAVALDPEPSRFAAARADCLLELDRADEAKALLQGVLRSQPDNAPAMCSLGRIHIESGDLDAAEQWLERALAIDPNRVQHWNNLGILRKRQFRHAEALEALEEAGRRFPLSPGTLYNKSFALLGVGQLAEGWDHYEVGVHANLRNGWRSTFKPIWNGEPLAGKRLGIIAEQGIGDQVMFLSCLEDFAKGPGAEAELSLEVHPKIRSLVARSYPHIEVCGAERTPEKNAIDDFEGHLDYVLYLGSLPAFVRRDHADFRSNGGFLQADSRRVDYWRERFASLGPEPMVGLCWRSMLQSMVRNHWYTALEDLAPIFTLPAMRFVSLQYGDARAELAEAERCWPGRILSLEDEVDLTNDLDEVAAVNTALTAVVAPNTTCSVISASVGCPTYEFAVGPAWHKLGTDRVPFFPTQKVFDYPFGTPLTQAIPVIRQVLQRDLGLSEDDAI